MRYNYVQLQRCRWFNSWMWILRTIFWGDTSDAIKAFQMPNKVIRLFIKLSFNDPCRQQNPNILVLRCLLLSIPTKTKFTVHFFAHTFYYRNSSIFHYSKHRTALFEKWFSCRAVFHSLPNHIKSGLSSKPEIVFIWYNNIWYVVICDNIVFIWYKNNIWKCIYLI